MGILIVDDSLDTRLLLKSYLMKNGFSDIYMATNAQEAFEILNINGNGPACEVNLILMDVMMPGMDGIEACHIIHNNKFTRDIPLIMVTAKSDSNVLVHALKEGAMDYIKKPFDKVELLARIRTALRLKAEMDKRKAREKELIKVNEKLKKLTSLDGLTHIANRRYFDEYFEGKLKESIEEGTPLTLIMLDIDQFKAYNDTYGHLEGDQCLKVIAKTLLASINKHENLAARYGGEEFAVILPNTNEKDGYNSAEKIRKNIEGQQLIHENSTVSNYITVSLGLVTLCSGEEYSIGELIQMADQALYHSKKTGRNKVTIYQSNVLIGKEN